MGVPALIDEIRVAGLERNRREDLLSYLNLKEGTRLDRRLVEELARKLRHSARFWTYSLEVQVDPSRHPPRTVLGIRVSEYPDVPPIGQPLARVQEAARRIGLWLDSLDEISEDLECEFRGSTREIQHAVVHVAVSPNGGLAFRARADVWKRLHFSHAGVVTRKKSVVYSVDRKRKFAGSSERLVGASATIRVSPGRLNTDQPMRLAISLGLKSEEPAFIQADVHPVVFVHFAEQYATSVNIRDDRITLEGTEGRVEADVVDGTITEVRYKGGDEAHLTVRVGRNAVEKLSRELEDLGASFPNDYDSDNPLPSALSFLLREYSYHLVRSGDEERARQTEALAKCVDEAVGGWWREHFAGRTDSDADADSRTAQFKIQHVPVTLENWKWLPHVGPYLADVLFKRGSAPWTLLREISFRGAEMRDPRCMAEVARLINSEEIGPLSCLFAAAVLGPENTESAASVARLGLSRMDEAHFRQDLRALLVEGSGMSAALGVAGTVVRSIPNDARRAVLARLPHGSAGLLGAWSCELDRAPEKDSADLLVEVIIDEWHDDLDTSVSDLLERYSQAGENAATR
jgi:hypothetical protein